MDQSIVSMSDLQYICLKLVIEKNAAIGTSETLNSVQADFISLTEIANK